MEWDITVEYMVDVDCIHSQFTHEVDGANVMTWIEDTKEAIDKLGFDFIQAYIFPTPSKEKG